MDDVQSIPASLSGTKIDHFLLVSLHAEVTGPMLLLLTDSLQRGVLKDSSASRVCAAISMRLSQMFGIGVVISITSTAHHPAL